MINFSSETRFKFSLIYQFWQRPELTKNYDSKKCYKESIRPKLLKDLGLKNIHQVPKVVKVNVNRGLGEAASNSKALEASLNEMATITGQKALVTRAKKAIAGFKIREGMPIGCTVTLRGDRMYSFLERFINLALPRIRDFRGVNPKSFDGRGNYTVGVKEQLIFPEISFLMKNLINDFTSFF